MKRKLLWIIGGVILFVYGGRWFLSRAVSSRGFSQPKTDSESALQQSFADMSEETAALVAAAGGALTAAKASGQTWKKVVQPPVGRVQPLNYFA